MIFLAAFLAAGAVVLIIVGQVQRSKARDIMQAETVSAATLATESADIAKEIGGGAFSRYVELKGIVESASPLVSEIEGSPCVHYRSVVTREYEERYEEKDSEGHYQSRTRRASEVVARNERSQPFMLRDDSGAVEIDPTGAKIEAEKSLSRFDQGSQPAPSLGSLLLNLAAEGLGGRRTLGYRLEEWTIPLGKRLYVLGEVSDVEGRLRVKKPTEKGRRFLISVRSEEEIVKGAQGAFTILSVLGGVLAAGALALAVLLAIGVLY